MSYDHAFSLWMLVVRFAILSVDRSCAFAPFTLPVRVQVNKKWSRNIDSTYLQSVVERNDVQTVAALERLLKRQKADVEMTENLIRSLKQPDIVHHDGAGDSNDDSHQYRNHHATFSPTSTTTSQSSTSTKTLSYAASIASGFDYGFVSRSEGVEFAELNGGIDGYGPPANLWLLGTSQFVRNWNAIKNEYKDEEEVGTGSLHLSDRFPSTIFFV